MAASSSVEILEVVIELTKKTHLAVLNEAVIAISGSRTRRKVGGDEKSDTRSWAEAIQALNANTSAPAIQVYSQPPYFGSIPTVVE